MPKSPRPTDETQRLDALRDYGILDTVPEAAFDDLASLAAQTCGTRAAAICLVDAERVWFKARVGIEAHQMPRDEAVCAHVVTDSRQPLVIENAEQDARFADDPPVIGEFAARFYTGVPLIAPGGAAIGTLCVADAEPLTLSESQLGALVTLGQQVVAQLELRRVVRELQQNRTQQVALREQFFSHVSLELHAPLTKVLQFLDVLQGGAVGEMTAEQRQFIELVQRHARQARRMTDDLVEASRLHSSRLAIDCRPLRVDEVLGQAVAAHAHAAESRRIEIITDVPDQLPIAHADPARLLQILGHLIDNAVKFNREGGSIRLSARERPADGNIEMCVSDTGPGIPAGDRERIFEQLFQAHGEERHRGLGLGLFITKGLVERHGGRIWIESEFGESTSVHFTIPSVTIEAVIRQFIAHRCRHASALLLARFQLLTAEGEPVQTDVGAIEPDAAWRSLERSIRADDLLLPRSGLHGWEEPIWVLTAAPREADVEALCRSWATRLAVPAASSALGHRVHLSSETLPLPRNEPSAAECATALVTRSIRGNGATAGRRAA